MSDWNGEHYKNHARSQEIAALKIIDRISFRGDERVLDIGCGTGNITKVLAEKVKHGDVIGIDSSEKMIQQALADYQTIENLDFQMANAGSFEFEKKFDLIVSFFALHWVKDHAKVIENVKRSLKDGGKICFLMISGGGPTRGKVFQRDPWKSEISNLEDRFVVIMDEDYNQLLDKFGFVKDCVEVIKMPHLFSTRKDMIQNFMTWLPYATGLSEERCLVLAGELIDNISDEPNQQTNIKAVPSILYVEAHI